METFKMKVIKINLSNTMELKKTIQLILVKIKLSIMLQ